jgi:hypothetical protein
MKVKILTTLKQSHRILDILRESGYSIDHEELRSKIIAVSNGSLTEEAADAWIKSWKHTHKNDGTLAPTPTIPTTKQSRIVEKGETFTEAKPMEGVSKIAAIIRLHEQGFSNKEIIAAGYNKSTVGRQVSEYRKRQLQKA